jgi:nucleotide-binding universal stress UspA family protein
MPYKTLLAVIQSKEDALRVLDCAVPLAVRFGGHLIGIHAEPMAIPYATPMGFPDADFIAAGTEINRERTAEIRAMFDERTRREGVSAEWQAMESFSGDSALSALDTARACDLVVVQQSDPDTHARDLANVEALLFDSGRPVLFVPHAIPVDTSFSKVVVAWNGTPEAARATFDALPFIIEARETEVLAVDPRSDNVQDAPVAAANIAEALARHGARVTVSSRDSDGLTAGETIERHITDSGATLLVMGAYSQSWLKQFFFGGATRTLLKSMPAATLMSR